MFITQSELSHCMPLRGDHRRAIMASLNMYLEGPGRERRGVRPLSKSQISIRQGTVACSRVIEGQTLIDDSGNVAIQVDLDGLRFQYPESRAVWSLLYS